MAERMYKVNDRQLTRTTGTGIPRYWLFLDTETNQKIEGIVELHSFQVGWTCLWNRVAPDKNLQYNWQFWRDSEELCKYIHQVANDKGDIILVGHNIYFDLQVCGFFDYFTRKRWQLQFLYDNQSTFILKCRLGQKIIVALSTTNWFDQPLTDLGELVGLSKLKIDFAGCSYEELKAYCRRDVEILVKIMDYYLDFIKSNKLGKFSYTKASQAFTAYRHRFLKSKIRIHSDAEVVSLERAAYKGGRTECFFIGQVEGEGFTTLDINSFYPYVMKKYEYPCKLSEYVLNPSVERLCNTIKHFCVIAEVELDTPEPAFAVIYNNKTVFPAGKFTTYLCTEGLRYALDKGYVTKVNRAAIYRKDDLFSGYVDYFHNLRTSYKAAGNDIMYTLCKYMSNSLYGKWGQKFAIEVREESTGVHDYFREEILDLVTRCTVTRTWVMNQFIVRSGDKEGRNAFVAIAAHVTENGRLLLWDIIKSIGVERILYCDTDSIKIRTDDLKYVNWKIDPYELGALKREDECKSLFIGGNKYYVTDLNRHIKGIPKTAIEVRPDVFEFYTWPKMTYHLHNGIITGYHRQKIQRRVDLNYDKGIVNPNGTVTPFIFPSPYRLDELPLPPF